MRDWIVIAGQPVDTARGGGFEFFGPFTEEEAMALRRQWVENNPLFKAGEDCVLAVQLLRAPRTIED